MHETSSMWMKVLLLYCVVCIVDAPGFLESFPAHLLAQDAHVFLLVPAPPLRPRPPAPLLHASPLPPAAAGPRASSAMALSFFLLDSTDATLSCSIAATTVAFRSSAWPMRCFRSSACACRLLRRVTSRHSKDTEPDTNTDYKGEGREGSQDKQDGSAASDRLR